MTRRFAKEISLAVALGAIASAILGVGSASAASTYYASPSGSGACTQPAPCALETALGKAVNGDRVVLAAGTYGPGATGIGIGKEIDFGGAGVGATVLQTTPSGNFHIGLSAKPLIHDLSVTGTGGMVLNSGTAERVLIDYTGTNSAGCSIYIGTTLRDSVCWAHDQGNGVAALEASAVGVKGTATLRNDTLVSESGGSGIYAEASSGGNLTVDAANVIARGPGRDVTAILSGGGLPAVSVALRNSNYARIEEEPPLAKVTPPGTEGNQTAAPAFLDAAHGDFREAAGSPTIDAGLTDALLGAQDVVGAARSLPTCIGGTAVPDIGAYELVPTTPCSAPPAPAGSGKIAPSNAIKLGKLSFNRKKGTATLVVTVPGPGTLDLSGKGVKGVKRLAHGAETLKLTVRTSGKAAKALAAHGSVKLGLRVTFTPTGGSAAAQAKSVTLRRGG